MELPDHQLIRVGISPHFHNKENLAPALHRCKQHTAEAQRVDPNAPPVYDRCWAFSRFKAQTLDAGAFVDHVLTGGAWTPSIFGGDGRRTNTNWQQAELIAIDYDHNVSVADCLLVPFIRQYALVVHPSASSGKRGDGGAPVYKTRVIFHLDNPITGDFENYRLAARAICRHLGLPADPASYKPAQLYYGSDNRIEAPHVAPSALLPRVIVDELTAPLIAEAEQARIAHEQQRAALQYRAIDRGGDADRNRVDRELDDAHNKVLRATTGERTTTIYGQAYRLGRLVPYWSISESDIHRSLLDGARANGAAHGYGESEIGRQIQNGIDAGRLDPEPLEAPTAARNKVVSEKKGRTSDQTVSKKSTALDTAQVFAVGLPDSWRSAVLRLTSAGALVLELITQAQRADLLDANQITSAALLHANVALGWGVSDSTLRRGLNELGAGGFLSDLHTEKETNTVCKIEKNLGGRPNAAYKLRSIADQRRALLELAAPGLYERAYPAQDTPGRPAVVADVSARQLEALGVDSAEARQIADELNAISAPAYTAQADQRRKAGKHARVLYARLEAALDDPTSTPLPDGWTPRDTTAYRAAYLRAKCLLADDQRLSRRQIADLIGVAARSVDAYLERAGIDTEGDQFEEMPLDCAANVEKEVTRLGYEVRGKPRWLIARAADGSETECAYTGDTARDFVPAQLADGAQVYVKFQVANKRTVDPDATPTAVKLRRAANTSGNTVEAQDVAPAPAQDASAPDLETHTPGEYSPAWVRAQLVLRLRVMGWIAANGRFVNPSTGEIARHDARAEELISLMLGREVKPTAEGDDLLTFAESLGAVVRALA